METITAAALTCVDNCSDFVFDPVKWPRVQMEEDFLKLSQTGHQYMIKYPYIVLDCYLIRTDPKR